MPSESWRDADYVCLSIRNRDQDLNHRVVLHRGLLSTDVDTDKGGDPVTTVETPTGWWGLWATYDLDPAGQTWGVDFGVERELHDGEELTRLWLNHYANETTVFSNGNKEVVGTDRMTNIFRFTYYTNKTVHPNGNDHRGKGFLAYWPKLEMSPSTTPLTGPPTRFWEKRGGFWEPRGSACIRTGATNTHTFTIN